MSRVPQNETDVPAFFFKWCYYFLRCRLYYIFALERNKVTNKAWFILRTPTDTVYTSRVAAITSDCLLILFTPPAASTLLLCRWWALAGGFPLDNRQRSSDNLRALFSIFSGYELAEPQLKKCAEDKMQV